MKNIYLLFIVLALFSTIAKAQQTFNSLNVKDLGANRLLVTSTTQGSKPCPVMTATQRDALSALVGQCVYNSTDLQLNIYDGSAWQSAGGGGIDNWETATAYDVGEVVIESNKIYQCDTAHTSSVFASDIANWTQLSNNVSDVTGTLPVVNGGTNSTTALSGSSIIVSNGTQIVQGDAGTSTTVLHGNASGAPTYGAVSLASDVSGVLPLANGGTNKNATANNGAIAYSDADSLELLAPGTSGQILQTNGAGAPSFVDKSISGKAQQATAVTLKEIQVYNNQLTDMTSGKYLLEGGNNNLLKDPSFEGDIGTTPWTGPNGIGTTFAIHGAQHGSRNYTAAQVNIYQDSTTNNGGFTDKSQQGLAMIYVKTNSDANNVYVCARQAGVLIASSDGTKITNCAPVPNDAKWNLIKLYVNLGTTSNGLAVVSLNPATAALQNMTGYVDVDGAFLGLVDSDFSTVVQQSYRISQGGSSLTNRNAEIQYNLGTASITNLGSALIVASDDSGSTRTRFTATTDVNVQINFSAAIASTGFSIVIYKNGSSVLLGDSNSNAGFIASAAYSMALVAGDYFSVGTEGDVSNTTSPANLSFIATSGTMKTYSASCGPNCVDSMSAQGSITGVVSNESVNFINGDCTNANPSVCTFNTGVFTVAPNCVATPNNTSARFLTVTSSSTVANVYQKDDTGVASRSEFTLVCQKQGVDFVATRTIVGSFNEAVTTKNIARPTLVSASVDASEVITENDSSFITSCTNADPSVCTVASSYFVADPKCWAEPTTAGAIAAVTADTTTSITIDRTDASTAFKLFCHGSLP